MCMCDETGVDKNVNVDVHYEEITMATVVNVHNGLLEHFNGMHIPKPVTIAAAILFIDRLSKANAVEFLEANAIVSMVKAKLEEQDNGNAS